MRLSCYADVSVTACVLRALAAFRRDYPYEDLVWGPPGCKPQPVLMNSSHVILDSGPCAEVDTTPSSDICITRHAAGTFEVWEHATPHQILALLRSYGRTTLVKDWLGTHTHTHTHLIVLY
jgi:hypothetical protein